MKKLLFFLPPIALIVILLFIGGYKLQNTIRTPLTLEDIEKMTIAENVLVVDQTFPIAKDSIYFATSSGGKTWKLQDGPVARYASVPDLISLEQDLPPFTKGTLLTYFVDGTEEHGTEDLELGLIYSTDLGKTWSDRLYTSMTDAPTGTIVVDPSVIQLSDGRLRLYFFDFDTAPRPGRTYTIHSAISNNGVNFTYESIVYESTELMTDPEIAFFDDTWYLFTTNGKQESMQVSISSDPLSFDNSLILNEPGIPGALLVDNELWVFGCGLTNGITIHSLNNGTNLTLLQERIVKAGAGINCDPSPTKLSDGTLALMFKFLKNEKITPSQ